MTASFFNGSVPRRAAASSPNGAGVELRGKRHRVAKALPRADAGDIEEMWQLIVDHQELIGRACVQRLGEVPEAEDAHADAIVRAAAEGPQSREVERLATLAREAVRRQKWWQRQHGHELAGLLPPPDGLDPEAAATWRIALAEAVRKLSPTERATLAAWVDGFSLSEAAWRLQISVDAFESRLRAVRRRLRALGLGVGAALADLLRRVRERARRSGAEAIAAIRLAVGRLLGVGATLDAPVQATACAALALLFVLPVAAHAGPAPVVSTQVPFEQTTAGVAVAARVGQVPPPSTRGRSLPSRLPALIPLIHHSAPETFQDTQLTTATAAPNFDSNHTMIGMGAGDACGCQVLYRTTDGGATWDRGKTPVPMDIGSADDAAGDPAADNSGYGHPTIVLPPTYPADPRIFVGNSAGGHLHYMAAAFDGPFTKLPLPAGQLVASAGLDAGDPRLFVATPTGVLSYNLDTERVGIVASQAGEGAFPPAIAMPSGDPEAALILLTSETTIMSGARSVAPGMLVLCSKTGSCEPRGTPVLPLGEPAVLAVSTTFGVDRTLLVSAAGGRSFLSHDAGATFSTLSNLPGSLRAVSTALTSTSLWVTVGLDSATEKVFEMRADGAWLDHTTDDTALTHTGLVLTPSPRYVILVLADQAVRCSADGGRSWSSACH